MILIETCPNCGSDLLTEVVTTYPPIYVTRCPKCGWNHETRSEIVRVPFEESHSSVDTILNNCDGTLTPLNCITISTAIESVQG